MKKITITAILAFIFAMATVSCEDDYDTRIPTFDGVTLTPDKCIPSTQITLSLNVKDKGENAYIYDTKITVVNDANPRNEKTFKATKGVFTLDNPTFKFQAPDSSGTYTVSVESKVSFSAGKTLYPTNQPAVQSTKLTVY